MQKYSVIESSEIVNMFLNKLKKGVVKSSILIEYFNLTLNEPIYEKLNCAYIQTTDQKEGILYEAVTNRFFYIKSGKGGSPILSSLTKSVNTLFPKGIKNKMFWVCGNRKDKGLEIKDFEGQFELRKLKNV